MSIQTSEYNIGDLVRVKKVSASPSLSQRIELTQPLDGRVVSTDPRLMVVFTKGAQAPYEVSPEDIEHVEVSA